MSDPINYEFHINDLFVWCNDIYSMREFYSEILGLKEIWFEPNSETGSSYLGYKMKNNQVLHFISRGENHAVNTEWSFQPSSEIPNGIEKFSWTLEMPKKRLLEIEGRISDFEVKAYLKNSQNRGDYSAITVMDPMGNTIDLYFHHDRE